MKQCRSLRREVSEQVSHILRRNRRLESFGHQRERRTRDLRNILPEDRFLRRPNPFQFNAASILLGDHTGNRTAILQLDHISDEVRGDLAIRIENVEEQLFPIPSAYRLEVRPDVHSATCITMTSRTYVLVDFRTARHIACKRER